MMQLRQEDRAYSTGKTMKQHKQDHSTGKTTGLTAHLSPANQARKHAHVAAQRQMLDGDRLPSDQHRALEESTRNRWSESAPIHGPRARAVASQATPPVRKQTG